MVKIVRKRVELALKKEGIPINNDTIKAFKTAMKLKINEVANATGGWSGAGGRRRIEEF